jgi:general secretion pathway protein M
LQTAVDEQGAGERCVVVSRNAFRNRDDEPFQRVTIQVRLRCELENLLPVLHGLESGSPQLFIGDLGIVARRSPPQPGQPAQAGYVDVSFNLYGYIRERGTKA